MMGRGLPSIVLWPVVMGCMAESVVDDDTIQPIFDTGYCSHQPVVSYANFGQGFMLENCQTCHASTSVERYGAPVDVVFDTEEDCRLWSVRILARAASENRDMPPQGGVTEDDRRRLEVWLTCDVTD